jgi:hypothetical protein
LGISTRDVRIGIERPFLLIAGDSADDHRSELFIKAAKPVYELQGAGPNL